MGKITRKEIESDSLYNSVLVSKFINQVMKDGKKTIARKAVYGAFEIMKSKKKDPLETFELAIENVAPSMEVRSKRVGGATYQVPVPVSKERKVSLAIRWILNAVKAKKRNTLAEKIAEELLNAANSTGSAIKKTEDVHRMAESNKAFAHFAQPRRTS
ncbi:MAG: 30S ribosomal protein S7 [Candidatus Nealsonbacteria bacterium]|nr:30S ribosomal protein S7 [Candidatus Nealsonbacteria bacterium]